MAALLPWLPLIVALLTATGGILAYAQQRRIDRRTTLMDMRRGYYRQFIEAWINVYVKQPSTEEDGIAYSRLRLGLYAVASDEVIRAFGRLNDKHEELRQRVGGNAGQRDIEDLKTLLGRLIQAMRADCFERSALSEAEIAEILPFRAG